MRRVLAILLAMSMPACSTAGGDDATLTVFAASSLAVAFEDIGARFEEANPGTDVVLSLAGSQTLATQIINGAQPDVFASADIEQMNRVVERSPPDTGPLQFATNRLVIVVAEGNPKMIQTVADLARDDLVVVLGAEEVPVGRYTRQVLAAAGVDVAASSQEPDVGFILTKVAAGEADAGVAYRSDLRRGRDEVEAVQIPTDINVVARYPIAAWARGPKRSGLAYDFVEFVTSSEGRDALLQAGFDS